MTQSLLPTQRSPSLAVRTVFKLVTALALLDHQQADFRALSMEGQRIALWMVVAMIAVVVVGLSAWIVRNWPPIDDPTDPRIPARLEAVARRSVAFARARAGRNRPVESLNHLLLLVVIAVFPIEWAHRALLTRSSPVHWILDAGLVVAIGAAIAPWPLGLRRFDRGGAPGPVWIWLYGHAMLPLSARVAHEEPTMSEGTVELIRFSSASEAEVISGVLESEGLEAFIVDDETGMTPGVRLMVAEADFARAKDLLAEHLKLAKDMPENVEPPDPAGV